MRETDFCSFLNDLMFLCSCMRPITITVGRKCGYSAAVDGGVLSSGGGGCGRAW